MIHVGLRCANPTYGLWAQLDALYFAYVAPRLPPPGAFVPDEMDDA